jgi:hypothetical protein
MTVHRTPHGGATALPMVVHTSHGGAPTLLLALSLGLVGIALGVAVPPDRQWWCPSKALASSSLLGSKWALP